MARLPKQVVAATPSSQQVPAAPRRLRADCDGASQALPATGRRSYIAAFAREHLFIDCVMYGLRNLRRPNSNGATRYAYLRQAIAAFRFNAASALNRGKAKRLSPRWKKGVLRRVSGGYFRRRRRCPPRSNPIPPRSIVTAPGSGTTDRTTSLSSVPPV